MDRRASGRPEVAPVSTSEAIPTAVSRGLRQPTTGRPRRERFGGVVRIVGLGQQGLDVVDEFGDRPAFNNLANPLVHRVVNELDQPAGRLDLRRLIGRIVSRVRVPVGRLLDRLVTAVVVGVGRHLRAGWHLAKGPKKTKYRAPVNMLFTGRLVLLFGTRC